MMVVIEERNGFLPKEWEQRKKRFRENELTRNREEDFSNVGTGRQDRFRSEISLSCNNKPQTHANDNIWVEKHDFDEGNQRN